MSTNFASLGIVVETSQVVKAADDLDKLVDSAEDAQKAVEDLSKTGGSLASAGKKISQTESEAAQSIDKSTSAVERQTAARTKSGSSAYSEIKLIEDLGRAMARSGESFDSLTQAEMLLGQARKAGLVTIEEEAKYHDQLGKAIEKIEKVEAKELVQKNRLIEAEGRRIETLKRTVNGIDPLTRELAKLEAQEKALNDLHKAGGIDAEAYAERLAKIGKDRAGLTESKGAIDKLGLSTKAAQQNVMQLANALQSGDWGSGARAITQIGVGAGFSAKNLAEMAIPAGLLTAIIGGIGYAYYDAEKEISAFNKALFSGPNQAGQTAASLGQIASAAGAITGNIGSARDAVVSLSSGLAASGTQIQNLAIASAALSEITGKGADEIARSLIGTGKNAHEAAAQISEQYGLLTYQQYEVIKAIDDQGDHQKALDVLSVNLSDSAQERLKKYRESLSEVERDWNAIKRAISNAYGAVRSEIFPDSNKQTEIAQRILETRKEGGFKGALSNLFSFGDNSNQALRKQIADAAARADADRKETEAKTDLENANRDLIRVSRDLDAQLTNVSPELRKAEAYKKLKEQFFELMSVSTRTGKGNPLLTGVDYNGKDFSGGAYDTLKKGLDDKFKNPKTPAAQVDLTGFNNAKNYLSDIVTDYRNAQKELEAQQKAGLVSLSDYARQRAAIINQEKNDVTAAYEAEISALEAAKAKKTTTAAQGIQLDQKIADARAGMIKAQKDADSQLSVLATNEEGRLHQLTAASESYVAQLERERAALAAAGTRAATGLGLGDRQASLQSSLDSSTDKFNDERAKLLDRRKTAPDKYSQEEYLRDLSILESAENKYRDTVVDNYKQMSAAQGDWQSGANSAYQNYLESARDISGQMKNLFTNAFSSMEDSVVNFAMTGKASFADFTKSILADMARIAARQAASGLLSSLAGSALGAYFGGGTNSGITGTSEYGQITSIPGRASGGPVDPNSLYEVNEKGPELFSQGGRSYLMTGADGGSVTPLTTGGGPAIAAMRGGGGVSVSLSMPVMVMTDEESGRAEGAEFDSEAFQRNMQERMRTVAREEISKSWRQGGISSRNVKG